MLHRIVGLLIGVGLCSLLSGRPPNIVIIMADDMGWGDVGFHGGTVPTPNLDRLAAEGTELTRFYVFPSCSPTRAAVLSGLLPQRLGIPGPVRRVDPGLPVTTPLLPQILQEAGYHTAMIGKWHLSGEESVEQRPHHRGFTQFYGSYHTDLDYFTRRNGRDQLDWWRNDQQVEEAGYLTRLQGNEGAKIIRETTEEPLFLFFAPHAPHAPFQAPEKTEALYADRRGRNAAVYAAMIDEFDDAVGQVLTAIDESEQAHNTLVIFFSDNGGLRFSQPNPHRGFKNTLYEGGILAPAVVRWPGVTTPGAQRESLSSATDLMPTLLKAAGVPSASIPESDGVDLKPLLAQSESAGREFLVIGNHQYVLITPDWKLVENGTNSELYHLANDPEETTDLAKKHPDKISELARLLTEQVSALPIYEARTRQRRRN